MLTLSEHPEIMLELTSETERTLLFDPAVIDANIDVFRQLAGDLNTQTANGILVHLEDLPYGRLKICWNPTPISFLSLDEAILIFRQYLREGCATCSDFKPERYARPEDDEI